MAYRAEIEIGVKGAKELLQLQKRLEGTSHKIDEINSKQATIFKGIAPSISNFTRQLQQAERALSDVAAGIPQEEKAVKNYVDALENSNAARARQNQLIKEEITRRNGATNALQRYNAAAAAATQRGAATTMAGSYLRGQPKFGPQPAPGFDPVAGAAQARASQLAQESISRGKQAKKDRDLINAVTSEVTEFQRKKLIDINNTKIGFLQTQLNAELDNIERVLNKRNQANREELTDFDRRLNTRVKAREKAEAFVAKQRIESEKRIATIRREALRSIQRLENEVIKKRQARTKQRKEAIGSGIIGGAFPLLFGQGPGAALGGGIGGFAGGALGGQFGFGLSLVGTQLGVIFDQVIAGATELGQALNPVTADINKLADAAGFAGTETEQYIKAIEQNAGKQAALKAATQKLALIVGQDGVKALEEFGEASKDLGNSWNQLMAQMSAGIAQLLSGPTRELADTLSDDAAFRGGLRQTEGPIGDLAKEYNQLFSAFGKGGFEKQVKDRERLNQLYREIVKLIKQENKELEKNLKITKDQQEAIKKIGLEITQAQTQSNLIDIIDKASKRGEEASKLRNRELEITARQEERIESLRINLENQVASIRQQNLAKEAQIKNSQETLELARLQNRLNQASASFANSIRLDAPGRDFSVALNKAANDFTVALATADAERNKNNRNAQLQLGRLTLQATQVNANINRQVSRIQLDTAKQITDLNSKAAEYDARLNQDKFDIEKRITLLQLGRIEAETNLLRLRFKAENILNDESISYFNTIKTLLDSAKETVTNQKPLSPVGKFAAPTSGGVSTTGFNDAIEEARELEALFNRVENAITSEKVIAASIAFTNLIQEQTLKLTQQQTPLEQRRETLEQTQEQARLVAEGFSKTDATSIIQGQQAFKDLNAELLASQSYLTELLTRYSAIENRTPAVTEAISALEFALNSVNQSIGDLRNKSNEFIASFQKTSKLEEYIKGLNEQLIDTEAQAIRVADAIGNAIGSSLDRAISGLIDGSATVKDVFADLLKSVGQILVQEGTKMIATYIAIGIAKAFAGLGGNPGNSIKNIEIPNVNNLPVTGRATGGPVNRNSSYLVGEQGPELFTPNQAGRISSTSDTRSLLGRSPVGQGAPAMNFTFETTNFGGKEFVDREQLEAAMAVTRRQAANDGASKGMSMTLDKMQHSPSTRRRVGIS